MVRYNSVNQSLGPNSSHAFTHMTRGGPIPLFDPPQWSSLHGTSHAPSVDGEGGWFVVRLPSTDDDGWIYGSAFSHLDSGRPGGRASRRGSDHVRRRVWRRLLIVSKDEQKKVVDATDCMAEAAAAVNVNHLPSSESIGGPSNSQPFNPERRSLPSPSTHSSGYRRATSFSPTRTQAAASSSIIYPSTKGEEATEASTVLGSVAASTSSSRGMSSGEAIIEALTETIEARRHQVKGGGLPSVLQLSKVRVLSCPNHGPFPFEPLNPHRVSLTCGMNQPRGMES